MSSAFTFAAACSTKTNTLEAIAEVCSSVREQLGGEAPNLAVVFLSADHVSAGAAFVLASQLQRQLETQNIIGCSGESIVATGQEIEGSSAVSLWVARLPGVSIQPMHLSFLRAPEGGSIVGWPDNLPSDWPAESILLALGDPYSFPVELLLQVVNEEHHGVPVVGGMASAASQPGENLLICGDKSFDEGAVAILLHGPLRVRTLVSQGCRPIGQPFVITKAEQNMILQLGGKPAYERLIEVYQTLATSEQEMVRRGLHVGRVVTEYQERFEQGDFLVRNVVGVDKDTGGIAIGDFVRVGQTVQFHVRDADTADGELRQLLAAARQQSGSGPGGGLLFTCNGRGTRLFTEPHHDASAISEAIGEIPLAGFFAAGELGPIGGQNFIHGFTASLALFYDPTAGTK
jgi:small ligand-binding sensory domain FIST